MTAYLSVDPLEPVLVFRTSDDAKDYQTFHNSLARIYRDRARLCYTLTWNAETILSPFHRLRVPATTTRT